MRNDQGLKIFSGSASIELTEKICKCLGVNRGKNTVINFSEGNIFVKIDEKVRGMDVYVIQTVGLDPNNEFMELLFWVDAFKRSGVNSVTVIMPYFSYAKADKKDEPRVSIRARVCADALEMAGVDRVVTMDLHSPQIQGFFRKPVDHLYVANIFCDHIRNMKKDNITIVSPDEGFAKNARYYSNNLKVPLAIGNKQRVSHDEKAEILNIIGDVTDRCAIMVDDFTISCGTLIETARMLQKKGASDIYAFVSHGLLSEKGTKALMDSPIKKLIMTDTVYNEAAINCPKIEIISIAPMFAKAIDIIHNFESLSELFE